MGLRAVLKTSGPVTCFSHMQYGLDLRKIQGQVSA